jgi:hypothetical protein
MKDYSEIAPTVKQLSGLLFSIAEIALAVSLPEDVLRRFLRQPDHVLYHAYHEGRLETKIRVHKSLIELAQNGSQPAITKVLEKQKLLDDEYDEE